MRPLAGFLLALWLIGGLVLTLQAAHPLPGQVVDDNLVPFHTLAIYWRNLGSEFWMRNLFGNLFLLLPLGLSLVVQVHSASPLARRTAILVSRSLRTRLRRCSPTISKS